MNMPGGSSHCGAEARVLLTSATDPRNIAGDLKDAFGDRLYAMLVRHRESADVRHELRVRQRVQRYGIETVAGMEVLYHTPARRALQDVLTCIRHGVTLSTAGTRIPGPTLNMRCVRRADLRSCTRTIPGQCFARKRSRNGVRFRSTKSGTGIPRNVCLTAQHPPNGFGN